MVAIYISLFNFAVSTPLISAVIISAVTLGVNQGLSAALTTADQLLDSLQFGDLLYIVTGNDTDERKLCNVRFHMG